MKTLSMLWRCLMKSGWAPSDVNAVKTVRFPRLLLTFVCVLGVAGILDGCAALKEAQEQRAARLKKERGDQYFMLTPARGDVQVSTDARTAESAHYSITFAEDLKTHTDFDEVAERRAFAESALGYMESLYTAMNAVFGFQPTHKIHVTLHNIYQGSTHRATTTTEYRYEVKGNTPLKYVTGIKMDFPLAMYKQPSVRVHELTHGFTNIYFLPTWFSEGLAVLMETEWAKGGSHPKFDSLQVHLKCNLNGTNDLEDWASHGGNPKLLEWRYRYAYTLVSELRSRYGSDLYIKVFGLMERDQLHNKLPTQMPTSFLIYYLNQAAGVDLVPFFEDLAFPVKKLTKADILQEIHKVSLGNRLESPGPR